MLSLMTLFNQSMTSRLEIKSLRTFPNTTKNVPAMNGKMLKTAKAKRKLIVSKRMLAPTMIQMEETMEETACETNNLIESTSAVRFVSNFPG